VYFGKEGREGTCEAKNQFVLAGDDVRVSPGALDSGASNSGVIEAPCSPSISACQWFGSPRHLNHRRFWQAWHTPTPRTTRARCT
jgi:hypothetical protein